MKFCIFSITPLTIYYLNPLFLSLQQIDNDILDKPIINVVLKLESDK
jgi:hypothetical protein